MRVSLFKQLLSFLFPERCRDCGKPGIALCSHCIHRIPFADPLPKGTYAVFDYGNKFVRSAIRELKYHHRSEYAVALAEAASVHISEYISATLQGINEESLIFVPIPEHHKKVSSRGFNQSALLAKWWSRSFSKSSVVHLLQKIVFTLPQAHLNRHARMHNVANTMQSSQQIDPSTIYIVVDDVTTTGATFAEARRALHKAGAHKVMCVALAHGYARK